MIQSPTHVAILELEYIRQDVRTIIQTERQTDRQEKLHSKVARFGACRIFKVAGGGGGGGGGTVTCF